MDEYRLGSSLLAELGLTCLRQKVFFGCHAGALRPISYFTLMPSGTLWGPQVLHLYVLVVCLQVGRTRLALSTLESSLPLLHRYTPTSLGFDSIGFYLFFGVN